MTIRTREQARAADNWAYWMNSRKRWKAHVAATKEALRAPYISSEGYAIALDQWISAKKNHARALGELRSYANKF